MLISFNKSKAFDRVDHRFLATVLETAGFKPEFRKWITMVYQNPQAVVQVNGKRSGAFAIECSIRQGCLISSFLYDLVLNPLLRRLRDEKASPALRVILLLALFRQRYPRMLMISLSLCLDIKAVKKVVVKYKQIAGAKTSFDKS